MALFESFYTDLVVAISVLAAFLYYWLTWTHNHWEKRNVPFIKPSFPFGNFGKTYRGSKTFFGEFDDFYRQLKPHGFGGVYNIRKPILVVCKPELIKQFLTKDFSSFHDREDNFDEENDPFSANLFAIGGQRWKDLRTKLSPTFTSGKIKNMFPLIYDCTQELNETIKAEIKKNNGSVEMQDLLVRFTTDVIGTCAFGVTCNTLKDPEAEFYKMGRSLFQSNSRRFFAIMMIVLFPFLSKFFTFQTVFGKTTEFFIQLVDRTVKYRRENKVQRNDFIDLMMKIMDEAQDEKQFNQTTMAAQAFLFFTAGLDNVSNNAGFCLHHLAMDQELQERVYNEINSVLGEFDGKMCYEALGKMDLLSRVLDEGLRMYTPALLLSRSQTADEYKIPGTDSVISKGTSVMIPIQAIHRDEEFFPNPSKFDPDRFTEEEKAKRHPYTYIPFGEGPRFCIAARFAQLELRLCLAQLLRHFHFSAGPKTDTSLELDPKALAPLPKKKFWLCATPREVE